MKIKFSIDYQQKRNIAKLMMGLGLIILLGTFIQGTFLKLSSSQMKSIQETVEK